MTADSDDEAELIELVFDRFDFLRVLDGDYLDKPGLSGALGYSRSTVDRAVRALSAAGLVVEGNRGYTTSLKGRYLLALFQSYRSDLRDVLELDPIVVEEAADYPLPLEALVGADVTFTAGPSPFYPVEVLGDQLDATAYGTFVFARRPNLAFLEELTAWITAGHSCRIVAPESVVTALWRESPVFLETIQAAADCSVRTGDVPPFSFSLRAVDGTTHLTLVDYDETGHPRCVVQNTSEASVAWGEQSAQSLWTDATPFDLGGHAPADVTDPTDQTAPTDPAESTNPPGQTEHADTTDPTNQTDRDPSNSTDGGTDERSDDAADERSVHGDDLPTTLHAQGFVRLSPAYFDRVGVSAPLACWRAGFDLGEVRAGYALDRHRPTPEGRENVTDDVFGRLRDGDDHVVVGPPGSGKSTVCMSVATRWFERECGPVVYRKSGQREPFTATAHLAAYLASTPGHALVVVEDATRKEANAVFELVREFADDAGVTFLLDSRESEWRDGHLEGAARLESHRTQGIDVVSVPAVDSRERERVVAHFEETVGRPVGVDPEEFNPGEDDELAPGEMYLFFHRLARYVGTATSGDTGPTALIDDIDGVYEDLRRVDETVGPDVGVLVNLLNAAGLDVELPLAYALAATTEDESLVEAALDELERSVLYSALGATDTVRTVHETWSTRFLQRLLDRESERRARRRFERCLSALFSLVDDEDARRRVQSVFGGTADVVRTIAADPGSWGDRLVENVFRLGVNNPTLSALFAETDYSGVDVPRACDADRRVDVRRWRARMFVNGGELDRAKREFESLAELGPDDGGPDDETNVRARADGFAGLAELAQYAGEMDRARDAARTALELFERIDDDDGRSDVLNALGTIEARSDHPEAARERYERALALREAVGNETKVASTLTNLARVEQATGSYDRARAHARQSLERYRAVGYRWGEALSLSMLAVIEIDDGTLTDAERYARLGLEIRREIGDTMGAASSAANLGEIERCRGDVEDAHDRYLDLLDAVADEQLGWVNGGVHLGLARTTLELGDPESALEHAERAVTRCAEHESRATAARIVQVWAHLERGDLDRARAVADDAVDRAADLGPEQQARADAALGRVLVETGDVEAGLARVRDAVDAPLDPYVEGRLNGRYADALRTAGRPDEALAAFERAVDCFAAVEATGRMRETAAEALDLAATLGDDSSVARFEARLDRDRDGAVTGH